MQAKLQLILDSAQYKAEAQASARAMRGVTEANQSAERATRTVSASMREMAQAQGGAARGASSIAGAARQAAAAMQEQAGKAGSLATGLKLAGAAGVGLVAVKVAQWAATSGVALVKMADDARMAAARIRLVSDSSASASVAMNRLYAIAQASGSPLQDLQRTYARLQRAGNDFGVSQRVVADATEALTLAARVSGASTQEASAAIMQFGQAMSSGRLSGEEFRSVSEQLPVVLTVLAKSLGVNVGELKAMAAAGKLETVPMMQALAAAVGDLREQSKQMGGTFEQAQTRLDNALTVVKTRLVDAMGAATGLTKAYDKLAEAADKVADAMLPEYAQTRKRVQDRTKVPWQALQKEIYDVGTQLVREEDPKRIAQLQDRLNALLRERTLRMSTPRDPVRVTAPAVPPTKPEPPTRDNPLKRTETQREWFAPGGIGAQLDKLRAEDLERAAALQLAQLKAAQEATDAIVENLTRGVQSAVAGLAEGLMTTGLRSARDFSSALGAALRRVIAEALAAGLTSRFLQPLLDTIGGQLARGTGVGGGITGPVVTQGLRAINGGGIAGALGLSRSVAAPVVRGGVDAARSAAMSATMSATPGVAGVGTSGAASGGAAAMAGASWLGPAAFAAMGLVTLIGRAQGVREQRKQAEAQFASVTSSFEGRRLRLAGRDREADLADLAAKQKGEWENLEAARQAELKANRDRVQLGVWNPAQRDKREREINERYRQQFDDLAKLLRGERERAANAPRGSIGDFNTPAGLNIAQLVGLIGRPVATPPTVAPSPGGTGAGGFTIIINGPVETQAKDAREFVRELRREAQQQFGTPDSWSQVIV